jgi:hypothetical protein
MQDLDNDDLPGPGTVAYLVDKIREGDPDVEGSRQLLRLFCVRAKKLKFPASPFPEPLLKLLVSAFEKYLSGEETDIAKSLGLKRRGKPPDPAIPERNAYIAKDVLLLHEQGIPLMSNRQQAGAFERVATECDLSEGEVRDIYYAHKNAGLALIIMDRWDDDDSA